MLALFSLGCVLDVAQADLELSIKPSSHPSLLSVQCYTVSSIIFVKVKSLCITVMKRTCYLYIMGTRDRQDICGFCLWGSDRLVRGQN